MISLVRYRFAKLRNGGQIQLKLSMTRSIGMQKSSRPHLPFAGDDSRGCSVRDCQTHESITRAHPKNLLFLFPPPSTHHLRESHLKSKRKQSPRKWVESSKQRTEGRIQGGGQLGAHSFGLATMHCSTLFARRRRCPITTPLSP